MEKRNGMHEKRSVSFVSQDDEKFRAEEKRIAAEANRGKSDKSFGAKELDYHRSTENLVGRIEDAIASGELGSEAGKKTIKEERERTEGSVRSAFETLFTQREQFPALKQDISLMLVRALYDAHVKASWGNEGGVQDEEVFWELFNKKEVPIGVLAAILEQRKNRQEQLQKEWNEKFEIWREQFRLQLQFAISEGIIPQNEYYDKRINDIQFIVSDRVVTRNTIGKNHEAGILSVQVEFRKESAVRKTLFHEMTHHIAGGAIQKTDVEMYQHDTMHWQSTSYINRKKGLAFNASRDFRERDIWINEGITELLARYFAKENDVTVYPYEQATILEIIKAGVPQELFINAYFESHLATPENGSRLPAFRALSKKMTEVYGAGWLKKFSKIIEKQYAEALEEDAL